MKTLIKKINTLMPYFAAKPGSKITKTSLDAFELRSAIMGLNNLEQEDNRQLFIRFYQRAYDYFARIYDKDNTELLVIIEEGFKLDFLTFFKLAVGRQIELTAEIKENISEYSNLQLQLYYNVFFANFSFILQNSKNIPPHVDEFTRKQIQTYISLYLEFLSDHGWTIRLSEFNLVRAEIKKLDDTRFQADSRSPVNTHTSFFVSREEIEASNFKEFKRFFVEINHAASTDSPLMLNRVLEDLLAFCNTIIISGGEQKSENIERLIDAIKQDDIATIQKIVIAEAAIISRLCPDTFIPDEMGFTPLLMAAKYCKEPKTLDEGMFCTMKNKADRLRYLSSKSSHFAKPISTYNSLLVAARWGTPAVFQYIFTIMYGERIKSESRNMLITILECICLPYLHYVDSAKEEIKQQQLKSRNEFLNRLADSLLAGQTDLQTLFGGISIHSDIQKKLAVFKPEQLRPNFFQSPAAIANHPKRQREQSVVSSLARDLIDNSTSLPANDSKQVIQTDKKQRRAL